MNVCWKMVINDEKMQYRRVVVFDDSANGLCDSVTIVIDLLNLVCWRPV
jgi:hypothetical protein